MDKWKISAIIGLFAMLLGYGAYQAQTQNAPPPEVTAGVKTPQAQVPQAQAPQAHTSHVHAPAASVKAPSPGAPPVAKQPTFVGKELPAWNIPASLWSNSKAPVTSADVKGSVTLVEIFRIECSHCQQAAPIMAGLYQKYAPLGLKMVAIQSPGVAPTESDWTHVQSIVKGWNWQHPYAFDAGGRYYRTQLGGKSYPSIYLIGKNGTVVYHHTGEDLEKTKKLVAAIEEALK